MMIVDECAGCSYGDIDLSTNILQQVTGYASDRKASKGGTLLGALQRVGGG